MRARELGTQESPTYRGASEAYKSCLEIICELCFLLAQDQMGQQIYKEICLELEG